MFDGLKSMVVQNSLLNCFYKISEKNAKDVNFL